MEIKIKEVVSYKGHNISANGGVKLNFSAMYSELTNTIGVLQMLNNDVKIVAKLPGEKAMAIGMFRVKNVIIDDDGESVLKFDTLSDYVEMDNLNKLIGKTEFVIQMTSDIEEEEDE